MAAIPGKRKPPTPPKPLLGCLADPALVDGSDSLKERCDSSVQGEGRAKDDHIYDEIVISACRETAVEHKMPILKTKTSGTSGNTSDVAGKERVDCVDVIKCSGDKVSLKPPLLPKPQTSPKVRTCSPKPGISSTNPVIIKCTNLDPSAARNNKEPAAGTEKKKPLFLMSTATNSHVQVASKRFPLHNKAPVAKLEEFEGFCDSINVERPVRPPRSPKHQPFKDEPFAVFDEKPEIPPKAKQWNCHMSGALLASRANFEALQEHWKTTKEKSASLGRTNAFRYCEAKAKSASLGRHSIVDHESHLEKKEGEFSVGVRNAPIPPPRLKKKQCGHSGSIPLYAEVNYNMKRNRRQAGVDGPECSECVRDANVEEVQDQALPGPKIDGLANKTERMVEEECKEAYEQSLRNDICHNIMERMKERDEMDVMKEASICGEDVDKVSECAVLNSLHIVTGCVISQDKAFNTTDMQLIKVDKNISQHTCSVDNRTSTSIILSPMKSHDEEFLTADPLPLEIEAKSDADKCLVTSPLSTPVLEKYSDSYVEGVSAGVQDKWTTDNLELLPTKPFTAECAAHHATEGNSFELYHVVHSSSEKLSESEVAVVRNSESVDNVNSTVVTNSESIDNVSSTVVTNSVSVDSVNSTVVTNSESVDSVNSNTIISVNNTVGDTEVSCADLVIVQKIEVASTLEADVSQNPDSGNSEYGLSPSSLPVTRKLDMTEFGKLHQQKQSWHNGKGDSPSPETTLHRLPTTHKRKSKARTWWCDEGDLSSGILGDLDSSDTTAQQSSVEDVDLTYSDVEDGPSIVRKKLSTWFSSLGKGNWKQRTRKGSNSQFYCDSQEKYDQRSREEEPAKEQITVSEVTEGSAAEVPEIEVDGFTATVGEGSRPSSGLSALSLLSALDVNQRSDVPVSEESFEVFQHSESDYEGEINPEDRDANPSQFEEVHHDKKAFYIAEELMTSERVFIDVLKLLNVDFRQSVQAAAVEQKCAVIPDADLDKILNSLPQLQSLNEDLLHDLEARINNWNSVKKIADVIVKKGPFLKLYTSYIQNFELQCIYFDECCQKYPKFGKVVKEFEGSPRCQKLSLKHYMLKPVQRIPQYRLLLEDYLRHLSETSPDRDDTHSALSIVRDVADHANRSIQLGDDFRQLLQLQSQLGNYEIIKPGRIFIKDGELFKLSRKGRQPRYFILLNDSLLYTSYYGSVPSSGLKVNYELPLSSIKVSIPRAEDYGNEFSIISVKRSFTLSARCLSERQEWVDALQKAIMDYTSRQLSFQNTKTASSLKNEGSSESFKLGQEAPVWIQDRRVTMCQSCTAEFTVTFRRHHCRACGKVVCSDCSDFRAPLQYMRFQSVRVCEECYKTLYEESRNPTSEVNQEMRQVLGNSVRVRDTFKKLGPVSGKKVKKYIPERLKEVTANDTGAQMSGWLQRRSRRSWKRLWFVLKEQVLYVYKASEDVVALESIPVLGYTVETMKERHFELYEGIDAKLVFQLAHRGQHPLIFHADSEHLANRWIAAMSEATILK